MYTTFKEFYRRVKASEDDPEQATSQLAPFLSPLPVTLARKARLMVEHFRAEVRSKIGGKVKAMVVASSRPHVVRYHQTFKRYIEEQGYKDVGVLVAFPGVIRDPDLDGVEFTEVTMNNGIKERELPQKQLLIVANEYLTGFDQPLLDALYVDAPISGVEALQMLLGLNRVAPGKEETFVLDFVNDWGGELGAGKLSPWAASRSASGAA